MTKNTVTFQAATINQVDQIQQLAHKIWPGTFGDILTPEQITYMMEWMYNTGQLQKEIRDEGIVYDLIHKDNICCGFVSYGPGKKKTEIKLHKVYIDPSMQRQGIGQAALNHVTEYARNRGAQTIMLRVNRNNCKAVRAYEKFGYSIREKDVADIGNGYVMDDYIMEYRVPEPERCPCE